MPVERHARFETEAIACAQPGRPDRPPQLLRAVQQQPQGGQGELGGQDDLDAVFAGVAAAGDGVLGPHDEAGLEVVALEVVQRDGQQRTHRLHCFRPLDRDHGGLQRAVGDVYVEAAALLVEPAEQLLAVGGVANDEEVILVA